MITQERNPSASTIPSVTFWGAAQMVTGSMHLVEVGDAKILLDCGLHQGRREEIRARNDHFPFPPKQISAVLVSHAHIDHCGNLPTLIRHGYRGPIYCTPATRDLLSVMLNDSAKIQEEEANILNGQRGYGEPSVEPLYTRPDVDEALRHCIPVNYHRDVPIGGATVFRFTEAGHVIGSAMIEITVTGPTRKHNIIFTGDLGRRRMPILKASAAIPAGDLLVLESTYGNRTHENIEMTAAKLYEIIRKTSGRGGKVLIPAFSLGRTQLVLYYLRRGIREKSIPRLPIFVDSPLAAQVAQVYSKHPDCLQDEIAETIGTDDDILSGDPIRYVRDFEESCYITQLPGPSIIIAASGMCDAGRIVHHLKNHVDDPRSTIALVSFQAPGTTGRRLLENRPTVRFLGKDWNKWIEVVHLEGFSAHADKADFEEYLARLAGRVDKVCLIHGEKDQSEMLAKTLREMGFTDVIVPEAGERVSLGLP